MDATTSQEAKESKGRLSAEMNAPPARGIVSREFALHKAHLASLPSDSLTGWHLDIIFDGEKSEGRAWELGGHREKGKKLTTRNKVYKPSMS